MAAKLDDIATTIDELKSEAEDGAPINSQKLDDIQSDVEAATETLDGSVDADDSLRQPD
ncbi:MAG TPA: hypothetical protein VL484_06360 [Vicinamibacterales bacterium]|nr:hypothetical protein [Vicinamibacterales bacterium]